METKEILSYIDCYVPDTDDLRSKRSLWECALQLSIIASKLPDPDCSFAELTRHAERAEELATQSGRKYIDLLDRVRVCEEHIDKASIDLLDMDKASMCSKPAKIYEHLRVAKSLLQPR